MYRSILKTLILLTLIVGGVSGEPWAPCGGRLEWMLCIHRIPASLSGQTLH